MVRKKGKFDKACFIPHQADFARFWDWRDLMETEREGLKEERSNRKKAAENGRR